MPEVDLYNMLAKSDDEKRKVQDYIQEKRQQHEEIFSVEKRLKDEQEKVRKDKLKKLNEQLKEVNHQHVTSSLTKRTSAFTPVRLFIFFINFIFFLSY
jgi:hypothetical protein